MSRYVRWVVVLFAGLASSSGCRAGEDATSEIELALDGSSLGMVVDNLTKTATVFNADTNTILGTVAGLGNAPQGTGDCSITADGRRGFFTRFNSSVTVVDLTTTPPSQAAPPNPINISNPGLDSSLSADQRFLVVCDGSIVAPISVIDVATQTQISSFNTGADCNSVDVCSDGSVLFTSSITNRARRLTLSASGILADTGESLALTQQPNNINCSPNARAGVVELRTNSVTSFRIPGLAPVTTRNLQSLVVSGAFNRAGDRAYFRTTVGRVTRFSFDEATGALGAAPVFEVTVAAANTFFGIDQMALHPSEASLYVPEPGRVRILDANTGATTGAIPGSSLSQASGVCFGARLPNRAPVARCVDRVSAADGTCHGVASIDDRSFDPDEGDTIDCVQSPSGPFDEGTTAVTLTCSDSRGASASCSATVTVVDEAPPDVTCPADETVECNNGQRGAAATFSATAIDNCDGDRATTCDPASGSTFPLGTTEDLCIAFDDTGNAARCLHNITVVDSAPPVVIPRDVSPLVPPDHQYRRVTLDDCVESIADACEGPVDLASHAEITCCTSDEPDNGPGDGNTVNDCVIVGPQAVDVRAERADRGNGRVYHIRYTVTDGVNTGTRTCTVGVPLDPRSGRSIDDGPATTCR
jgi:hypothetical protein